MISILLEQVDHMIPNTSHDLMLCYVVAASSGLDGYIHLWDLESGKQIRSIDGGPGELT